jgi:molybdopterin synthase catalytic subunit
MRVRVLFFGVLKDLTGKSEELLEVSSGSTIASVFDGYLQRFATLEGKRSSILFARNHEFVKPETELKDNDEVAFLPPVSGGSGTRDEPYAAMVRQRIDSQGLAERVRRDEDGAVVTFEGVVRNNTKGRATRYLEYEAYEPMAVSQMRRIAGEVASNYEVSRVAVVHRLGRLEIGEASIAIAVSAPHRKPAFEAALETINRLKREVPIWKKEFFADGEVWVEGEWDERLLSRAARDEAP